MNNRNIKIIFIIFVCCLKALQANDICPAVKTIQNLSRQYKLNPSIGKADEIRDFVVTGNYAGDLGNYSGLNYQREANAAERKAIFQAIIITTLKPQLTVCDQIPILGKYAQSISDLELNRDKNPNYQQDLVHRSISYIVALLSVDETIDRRNNPLDWSGLKQKILSDLNWLSSRQKILNPTAFNFNFIENLYCEKAFQEAFLEVTGKNLCYLDSHPYELKKPENEWKTKVIKKLQNSSNQYSILSNEYLIANPITVVTNNSGSPIAHVLQSYPRRDAIYQLAQEIGIGDHFAPQMTYKGQKFEEFIQLGSPIPVVDREVREILQRQKGKYEDITLLRIKNADDEKKVLKNVHPDSIDRLFVEQIVLGTADSTPRNFLLIYRDKGLQLVRIDYADWFTTTTYFFGENFEESFKPFSSYGINILKKFITLIPNDEIWEVYLEDAKRYYDQRISEANGYNKRAERENAKKQIGYIMFHKKVYQDRIKILGWMFEEGFFNDNPSRFETLIAMTYFGIREATSRNSQTLTFPEHYFVDNYFIQHGEQIKTLATIKNRDLFTLSRVCNKFSQQYKNREEVKCFTLSDCYIPVTENVIRQAVYDWKNTSDFLDLPGIRELIRTFDEGVKKRCGISYH